MTLIPEWFPQSSVLLTWPHSDTDWQPTLERVETCYCELVAATTCFEECLIICRGSIHQTRIEELLKALASEQKSKIRFAYSDYNDTWIRDYGPLSFQTAKGLQLLDFQFNAWGGKFDANKDNLLNQQIAKHLSAPIQSIDFILEGGSVETDGNGSLLTTSQCLLSGTRNTTMSTEQIEATLKESLNISNILWLNHGYLTGDDTDAHIDTLARFCPNNTICYQSCNNKQDEHFEPLQTMAKALASFTNKQGEPYKLIALPWPETIYADDGHRLPVSYANFLVINNAVLVPIYNDAQDIYAMQAIGSAYPNREIIGIDCTALIEQHGSLHCATIQLSKSVRISESSQDFQPAQTLNNNP